MKERLTEKNKRMFSELNFIISLMDEELKERIPKKLRVYISKSINPDFIPKYNNELPFITTKTIVPNRKIFLIDENDKFIYKSPKGRKGKYVKPNYMIDGAAYLINTSFLNEICTSKNPNKVLWESNFKTVLNDVPFIDIDTQKDMNDFLYYINIKEG